MGGREEGALTKATCWSRPRLGFLLAFAALSPATSMPGTDPRPLAICDAALWDRASCTLAFTLASWRRILTPHDLTAVHPTTSFAFPYNTIFSGIPVLLLLLLVLALLVFTVLFLLTPPTVTTATCTPTVPHEDTGGDRRRSWHCCRHCHVH